MHVNNMNSVFVARMRASRQQMLNATQRVIITLTLAYAEGIGETVSMLLLLALFCMKLSMGKS